MPKTPKPAYAKGAPGKYTLNQKVQKFDPRPKRERDRSSKNRIEIKRSKDGM